MSSSPPILTHRVAARGSRGALVGGAVVRIQVEQTWAPGCRAPVPSWNKASMRTIAPQGLLGACIALNGGLGVGKSILWRTLKDNRDPRGQRSKCELVKRESQDLPLLFPPGGEQVLRSQSGPIASPGPSSLQANPTPWPVRAVRADTTEPGPGPSWKGWAEHRTQCQTLKSFPGLPPEP